LFVPTYECSCPSCGHRFDIWQAVGSEAPACEKCASATKKVFQPPRVIFKGSGFYLTDKRAEQGVGEKTEAKSEAASEAKTETKPENKSESAPSAPSSKDSTPPSTSS
jgi:putative FmdB family regulatory protein